MKLLFLTNNLPFSVIIRGLTFCQWSHVAVAFDDVVYEARLGGVSTTSLEKFKERGKHHVVDIELPDELAAEEYAKSRVGGKYDFLGIFALWFNRDWESSEKDYCSEYFADIAKAGGLSLFRDGLKGISPRDVWVLPL